MSDLVERLQWWGAKQKPPRGMDTLPADCREAASRISQQDAELERMRRELAEAQEFRAILEGHLAAAIDDYNDARKAAFIEVAEMASLSSSPSVYAFAAMIRAKAEEART